LQPFEVWWKNFRSLRDTGWVEIRPLTVVIGPNCGGKTSLLAPLLLLKQTQRASDPALALKTNGPFFDAGPFQDLVTNGQQGSGLTLSLRFHHDEPEKGKKLKPPPEYPPGAIELHFSKSREDEQPVLDTYVVRDVFGQVLLRRARNRRGSYGLVGLDLSDTNPKHLEALRRATPTRFLFTVEPTLGRIIKADMRLRRKPGSPSGDRFRPKKLVLSESANTYFTIISMVTAHIVSLLSGIRFVGPLRTYPRRIYELSGERPDDVGTRGQFAPEMLFRDHGGKLLSAVNAWIERFAFGLRFSCEAVSPGAFTLKVRDRKNRCHNFADTGFGLSQVLPLIVQSMKAQKDDILVAEQPEIHLNPRLQALLADLFCDVVKRGAGVLVETHSEHLLLRLRRLVAEGVVQASNVSIVYAEKQPRGATVRQIPISNNGHIPSSDWPHGFFEDSLRDSLALASAQSR
jgi:predicted ATPase